MTQNQKFSFYSEESVMSTLFANLRIGNDILTDLTDLAEDTKENSKQKFAIAPIIIDLDYESESESDDEEDDVRLQEEDYSCHLTEEMIKMIERMKVIASDAKNDWYKYMFGETYATRMCKHVEEKGKCTRNLCGFAHSKEELRKYNPPMRVPDVHNNTPAGFDARYRTKLCTFGEKCTKDTCGFAHFPEELRNGIDEEKHRQEMLYNEHVNQSRIHQEKMFYENQERMYHQQRASQQYQQAQQYRQSQEYQQAQQYHQSQQQPQQWSFVSYQ